MVINVGTSFATNQAMSAPTPGTINIIEATFAIEPSRAMVNINSMPTIELPKTTKAIAPQKGNVFSKISPSDANANGIEMTDANDYCTQVATMG
jgi:hypothetical protein